MMRLSIFICLLVWFSAQGQNIKLGTPYPVVDAGHKTYFSQGNDIIEVKYDSKKFVIQKLDAASLKQVSMKPYTDFPDHYAVESIQEFQEKLFLFYSYWNGQEEQLFSREIDFGSGEFKGKANLLISHPGKISGTFMKTGYFSAAVVDKFDFYFSYDQSLMVIQFRSKPKVRDDSKNYDEITLSVFNKELNSVWKGVMKMPYTEKKMNNLSYAVDSQGSVYIVAEVYKDDTTDKKKKGDDGANYTLEILKYKQNSSDPIITKIDLADKFLHSILLTESPTKSYMSGAGFYNNGKKTSSVEGVYKFNLGRDGKIYNEAAHPIPLQILNQYVKASTAAKNQKKDTDGGAEFENLVPRYLTVQEDGSLLLTGEQYFTITYYNGRSSSTDYIYNDIFAAKIDADGTLGWMAKLPKRQKGGSGRGGMSFNNFNYNGKHHFIFLDNQRNRDLQINEVPATHADGRGGFLSCYSINDKDGSISKTYLADITDIQGVGVYQFSPSRAMLTPNGNITFEGYKKGKEDVLIQISLPK